MSTSFSVAKLRKIAASCLQDTLRNLYNVRTKLDCADKPFKSSSELPCFEITSVQEICSKIKERLRMIFLDEDDDNYIAFVDLTHNILKASTGACILCNLNKVFEKCWEVVEKWDAAEAAYVGVIPHKADDISYFTADTDEESRKCYLLWDKDALGDNFLGAVSRALRQIRDARRQPTPSEYLGQHLAYMEISAGKWGRPEKTRSLGTPGFRPHTQTYMSLTDPGEGHINGTTRFSEWMDGAIVHVEHLERPNHRDRQAIESYRVPSVLDFSRVRLHVGPTAPTTYFLGRAVKDSGNFDEDFLKIVHITAAAASAAFFMGAAEVKISMERLSTSQAMRYMHALRAQVQRSRMQYLSAAWNLNQQITDDFEMEDSPILLTERLDIALKAVAITSLGGFDKVTWDGASDTYPSKCIMYQLSFEEALTVVHEAHLKGLVTYFSAGFKFDEIQHAVYAGVDGIGIGGAQVLRFMDKETGMHGPYMEENIPRILSRRDEAARSLKGRGVDLLVRLDTMYFEGSITRQQEYFRQKLFKALLQSDAEQTEEVMSQLSDVIALPREGNTPVLYRAKRLVEADKPMLQEICSEEEWDGLVRILRHLIVARDERSLLEEYDSDPWLSIRQRYRLNQCPRDSKICFVRQTSFTVPYKC